MNQNFKKNKLRDVFFNNHFAVLAILCFAAVRIHAQDARERYYYYEVLEPKHEHKPKVDGYAAERVTERLNRGLTAVPAADGEGVYLSWRMLSSDGNDAAFHVYRETGGKRKRLTRKPVISTCDFIDKSPVPKAVYSVMPVRGMSVSGSVEVELASLKPYTSIKLKDSDRAGKLAIADLNGDGTYDYIVRTPSSNVDPGMPGDNKGVTYKISAYLSDGTYLWTYDLGPGIEPGVWYSPFVAYDFDGDGRAEVALKTSGPDFVKDKNGRVCGGSEFMTVLDGMTGKEIASVPWPERNGRYGNIVRQNRNQMGVAFLDGKTPYILAARGTYKLMVVDAWMLNDGKLTRAWRWDGDEENPVIRSMGAHSMVTGDVDKDGRDEILLGSCMLDDNGTALWSSGIGHSDKAYLCKLRPDLEGLQVFMVSEPKNDDGRGVSVVDAGTGKLIWGIGHTTYHVGSGMVADFNPEWPGLECFASEDRKGGSTDKYLLTADGKKVETKQGGVPGTYPWLWWDADLLRETTTRDGGRGVGRSVQSVWKWKDKVLTEGIEGSILMTADIDGDWREEIVTALPGELRVYRTSIHARDRRVTLMQDPLYRSYIMNGSMGYPQSPVTSYYLGE
ncbi:silent information regulator protein Sir2 [Xylanibacter muris]|uniref:Silent information regulator protein Sir2 n=1 Tax=Xylanibacter muris TaxID=2736290 RepID=A0ABX2AN10_9BACT|nr:silent information regulator protein Sir2 [Xylanibacter muris]NPD91604.1 silent information regulator protein Sir2 [Xylanibacter muris]